MKHDFQSINCYAEALCGDSFLCEHSSEGTILVHSDGMGHGPKANVLSELTCEIVMSEWGGLSSLDKIMETLALRLPICAVRGLGFSTFTLIEYDARSGSTTIVEYENPPTVILRDDKIVTAQWDLQAIRWKAEVRQLLTTTFTPRANDRIVVVSDGVTQSGMGREQFPFGWGQKGLEDFLTDIIRARPEASCGEITDRILNKALTNENYYPHDDISALTVIF